MPSGPIQTQPGGLLGLLQLKNMGRNPDKLADQLQPVWDLQELYLQSQVENQTPDLSVTAPAAASGGFVAWATPAIVPAGEMWWVWNYSVLATTVAADTMTGLRPLIRTASAVTSQFARIGTDVATKAGAGRIIVGCGGFWLSQGQELGLFTENLVSPAGVACLGYVNFTRLPL